MKKSIRLVKMSLVLFTAIMSLSAVSSTTNTSSNVEHTETQSKAAPDNFLDALIFQHLMGVTYADTNKNSGAGDFSSDYDA